MSGNEPEPRRLEFLEEMQERTLKDARAMLLAVRPVAETLMSDSMQSFFRSVQTAVGPMLKLQEQMRQETDRWKTFSEPKEYMMPSITYAPRVVRLDYDQFDELVEKVSANTVPQSGLYMDLMYEQNTKELYRYVFNRRFASSFKDTEDNKRLLLVSKLIRNNKPVATRDLAESLDCSQKQIQNLVQAVNAKLERDLKLPQSFIVANRGSGYYVSKFYCVYTTE